jgi:hypothetical protein
MPQIPWISLPAPQSALPLLKALNKKHSSTSVVLLLAILFVFAAAAFCLAATAQCLTNGAAATASRPERVAQPICKP